MGLAESLLLQAVLRNSPELYAEVQKLIDVGVDLNEMTRYGESPIRVASRNGRFDVVELLIYSGADSAPLQFSCSMYELLFGSLEKLSQSLIENRDLEAREYWERTPFLLAVQNGNIEKAEMLLALGADLHAVGRCGKTCLQYAIDSKNTVMLDFLLCKGVSIECCDKFKSTGLIYAAEVGATDAVKFLIDNGANVFALDHIPNRAIQVASNIEIVRLLVSAGDSINDINEEIHAELVGIQCRTDPDVDVQTFEQGWRRIFGASNPEKIENPFWLAMIKSGATAWQAASMLNASEKHVPVWCYERFGRTTNLLSDGRIIEIGGEHEDYYDPNFCIYNDVTVFDEKGLVQIYIYPESDFPPIDFHSATLVDKYIYIIGGLGYQHQRKLGLVQVFCLDTDTFNIRRIKTSGRSPGFIYNHKARLIDGKFIEVVAGTRMRVDETGEFTYFENTEKFELSRIQVITAI